MKQGAIFTVLLTLIALEATAIEDLKIRVQGSNVVLHWPSVAGETFIVQHRPTLETNTPWASLTNSLPAASSTNRTSFTHQGIVQPCGSSMMSGGGGESLQAQSSGVAESLSGVSIVELSMPVLARWEAENREPYPWELEQRPPLPWEALEWNVFTPQPSTQSSLLLSASAFAPEGNSLQSLSGGCPADMGFYRVYKTSPTARADYLLVQQDSGANQLNILDNDSDPDDEVLLLSAVSSASHGTIQASPNASVFLYTPASGYYGQDSFTYTITNLTKGRATATVRIFVNKTGNQRPSVAEASVTLPANVYTASITALAGASDPDGDPVTFVAVTSPRWGTVTNIAGQLAYAHPSNCFGDDAFDYYVTDGRGGLGRAHVSVLHADQDGDGMADEWEMLMGLNPSANDATSDLDGDGLPNLAEYKLGTDPRRSDNPLNLDKIVTGQVMSDYARVSLSLNPRIEKLPIKLLMNGNPCKAFFRQGADGGWFFEWDTGYLTNGNYSIATSFQYNSAAQPPTPGSVSGQAKSVRVTNEVILDQINSEFSSTWYVHPTFAYPQANWRVEMYDEDGSGLVYFDGSTTDGDIFLAWDLTDTGNGGDQISFGNILAYFYAAPTGQGLPPVGSLAAAKTKRWFTKQIPGGIGDKFVIAWGWDAYSQTFSGRRENLMLDGVINIIGNPGLGDEYLLLPAFNNPFGSAFRYDTEANKDTLLDALKSSEAGNFFWFGHGDSVIIQGNAKKSAITSGDIENALRNKKHRSRPPRFSLNNQHPYRLVILNGCTTYSSDWADAFGIDFTPGGSASVVLEYQFLGRSPQAFVGWTAEVVVPGSFDPTGLSHTKYSLALAELFSRWMGGFPLDICLDFFGDSATGNGFTDQDKWKISGCVDLQRNDP